MTFRHAPELTVVMRSLCVVCYCTRLRLWYFQCVLSLLDPWLLVLFFYVFLCAREEWKRTRWESGATSWKMEQFQWLEFIELTCRIGLNLYIAWTVRSLTGTGIKIFFCIWFYYGCPLWKILPARYKCMAVFTHGLPAWRSAIRVFSCPLSWITNRVLTIPLNYIRPRVSTRKKKAHAGILPTRRKFTVVISLCYNDNLACLQTIQFVYWEIGFTFQ
jgi:hypothetical protein